MQLWTDFKLQYQIVSEVSGPKSNSFPAIFSPQILIFYPFLFPLETFIAISNYSVFNKTPL